MAILLLYSAGEKDEENPQEEEGSETAKVGRKIPICPLALLEGALISSRCAKQKAFMVPSFLSQAQELPGVVEDPDVEIFISGFNPKAVQVAAEAIRRIASGQAPANEVINELQGFNSRLRGGRGGGHSVGGGGGRAHGAGPHMKKGGRGGGSSGVKTMGDNVKRVHVVKKTAAASASSAN